MLTKKQWLNKTGKQAVQKIFVRQAALPVFVFGSQRSGTNMLMDVLKKHLESDCYDENDQDAFDNYVLRDNKRIQSLVLRSRARVAVFKAITSSQHAAYLLQRFPASRAVWIFRHYNDVVNSALRRFTEHRTYLWYILHAPDTAGWRSQKISAEDMSLVRQYYDRGIDDASARALIWYLRNALFFQQDLGAHPRTMLVNYEQMVVTPGTEFLRIFEFLGLKFQPAYAGHVFSSSVSRHAAPDIDPEIEALCRTLYRKMETTL